MNTDETQSTTTGSIGTEIVYNPDATQSRWMTRIRTSLEKLKIGEMTLISSHNAGMDNKAYNTVTKNWTACQSDGFQWQLDKGIRVFDLRLRQRGGWTGDQGWDTLPGMPRRYSTYGFTCIHGPDYGRKLTDLLDTLIPFVKNNPDELVILDIHKVEAEDPGTCASELRRRLLQKVLGGRDGLAPFIIPPEAWSLTWGEIKQKYPGRSVVVGWNHGNKYSEFWSQIPHKWIGKDTNNEAEVHQFIGPVIAAAPTNGQVWSLSATVFKIPNGPKKIGKTLDSWFPAGSVWASKCNIINVDFFETSNLIEHAIQTNIKKAQQK
ncbi:hypothetical protein [Pseudomonas sp. NA-150]|uniref:hypothetical protein n=1 Tax=Pseudomonas sp. NA-150 TaxID=3367525 RepID=UPI0037CB119F